MDLSPGTRLGPYEIVGPLGSGGMGEVYRARDTRLDRLIAIKVLSPRLVATPTMVERFQREAKTIAALNHPNICTIYDVGLAKTDVPPYITMELLDGETLQARLERPMPLVEVTDIGFALADALAAAHGHGIIHRDIKPSNIVLTARGPKILDFGLAKTSLNPAAASIDETRPGVEQLTEVGGTVGTIAYMSPEQIRGEELDARSDIFSLGLVLYEMVAGYAAFAGPTPMAVAAAILHDEPPPLSEHRSAAAGGLDQIIGRTLEKDRKLRYQSALDVRTDLERLTRTAKAVVMTAVPKTTARRGWLAAAAVLALAVVAGVLFWMRSREPLTTSGVKSLAVLPFTDISQSHDQQSFADGLTVSFINAFSRLPDLDVRGQESSFALRDRKDLRSVGETLRVQYVVTGTVDRAGDRLRIVAALEDVRTGSRLWSEQYSQPFADIFEVQDQITANVSRDLGVTLGLGENAESGMTRNTDAYDEYLQGFGGLASPISLPNSIAHLHRAVQLDPDFWQAHLLLRETALFAFQFQPQRAEELQRTAAEALATAEKLAPDAPRVLAALADQRMREGRWLEHGAIAQKLFSKPDVRFPSGLPWRGIFLLAAGRAREAVAPLQRARDENPLMPARAIMYAVAVDMTGRPAAALEEINALLEHTDNDIAQGTALLIAMGMKDAAEIQRRSAVLKNSTRRRFGLEQYLNDPADVVVTIQELARHRDNQDAVSQSSLANWAAYFGQPELALQLIKRAVQMPTYNPGAIILWRPVMRDVRKLPGFKDLVRSLNYVEYWDKFGWPDFCRRPTRATGDDFICE